MQNEIQKLLKNIETKEKEIDAIMEHICNKEKDIIEIKTRMELTNKTIFQNFKDIKEDIQKILLILSEGDGKIANNRQDIFSLKQSIHGNGSKGLKDQVNENTIKIDSHEKTLIRWGAAFCIITFIIVWSKDIILKWIG